MLRYALGLVETKGLIGAIVATDAAAKAAAVVVSSAELTDAALLTVKIEGELGAVQAATEAAAEAAEKVCELISVHVIPRPDDDLDVILPPRRYVSKYHPDDQRPQLGPDDAEAGLPVRPQPPPRGPGGARGRYGGGIGLGVRRRGGTRTVDEDFVPSSARDLETMSVVQLRRYARSLADLSLKGREISTANRQRLSEEIRKHFGWD